MNILSYADTRQRFAIYLNDQRATFTAEGATAQRSLRSNRDIGPSALVNVLADIVDQNSRDICRLDQLLDQIDGTRNAAKVALARAGNGVGRLKLNGQLRGYSPLSRLIEVEGLLATAALRRAMWEGIAVVGPASPAFQDAIVGGIDDARTRASIADKQHRQLTNQHRLAFETAFRSSRSSASTLPSTEA